MKMDKAAIIEKQSAELLRDLVTEFIFHPENLDVKSFRFSNIISIAWSGHRADTSRMIGSGGETYNALRALLKLVGEQHGCELELARVGTPTVGQVERYAPFKKNPSWPRKQVEQLIERAAQMATRHGRVEVQMADIDDDRTGIKVRIAKNETQNTESTLTASLKHVFKVIGNSKGRILLVEVARELEPEEDCQPALNRGRYSNL